MRRAERFPLLRRVPSVTSTVEDDLVLFESWRGRFADNPRAVSEHLAHEGPPMRQCWVLDEGVEGPPWAEVVRPGTYEYIRRLSRARYIVTSNNLPAYFRKSPTTTYLQTWHGTPLKRLAFDVRQPSVGVTRRYLRALSRDVANWDVLLAQNHFSAEVFRRAFRYSGRIAETGYPRNVLLTSADRAAIRERVRSALGADGRRLVLYAPTWRDSSVFEMTLDPAELCRRLGDEWMVLLRLHPLAAAGRPPASDAGLRDVTAWEDVRELYLAADVLVTDYSSAMFDFAVTGKPMLFFVYDFDWYRDELRGFYLDLERDAPGPLVRHFDELVDALGAVDDLAGQHAEAYGRFRERFCGLDDGEASARALECLLGQRG